jgi:murein DD-endopeptidase MepM/ murein hydrolase activator NlpD
MENQVTQLKLNVTNIKNSLFSSNKQLKKLKTDKKNLFFKLEKKKELRAEETRLETPRLRIGSGFSKIMSAVTSPVRSIFDRILDFIGLIAAGILINNLPSIIKKIQDFFDDDFIKGVGNVLGIIGNGILGLAKFVGIFPKSEQNKIEKNIKETDKRFDEDIKDADAAEKDIVNLEKDIVNLETNLGENETDTKTDETLIRPVESDSSIPQSISEPSPKETSSTSTTESNTNPLMPSKPAQSFNTGGTVRSEGPSQTPSLAQKQTYTPQKSGVSKKVQRDANDGFTKFPIAVDNIHKSTKEQEKNIIAFSKMLKDSRGLGTTSSSSGSPSGPSGPGGPSGNGGGLVNIPGGGKISGDASVTQRNDPDAEQTGIDISLRDSDGNFANGALIQNPFQSLTITSTGSQINPNGSGYGNYVTGETIINGKKYELLIGHLGKISVSKGQILNSGHILGTQGMTGSSTGPHVTTHINALDGGNPQTILNAVEDSWINGTVIKTDEKKSNKGPTLTPSQQNKYRNNKGGGYRLNRSMNNQSVFIYAIQPQETFVPFPYPMPIETPAPSSSSTPQLSAIWRT